MKVVVYGHQLEIGGSQVNSIELAARLRDVHGHEIIYFATPGPMVRLVADHGLRFVPAPDGVMHPSPARMKALRALVRNERPDLVHAWDWWQAVDAFYGVHLPMRVPLLVSHMMMDLTRLLPKAVPTTYGTPELCTQAIAEGRLRVSTLLPPVDVRLNAPGAVNASSFVEQHGIMPGEIVLVTVSRLHRSLKSESLFRTVDAVRRLGTEFPIRLFIVGEGELRDELAKRAKEVNAEIGRDAVVLTGAMMDPRPAYAAADIVVGMGGSALRAMALGKPVVIVGEQGFAVPFTPDTADDFYYKGIYGRATEGCAEENYANAIRTHVVRRDQLSELGRFSRQFVVEKFSLDVIAECLADDYRRAMSDMPGLGAVLRDGLRTATITTIEGRLFPIGVIRNAYYQWGGPPVFSYVRKAIRGLKGRC